MDIASMLEREDFYTILRNTLRAYYQRVHNKEIRVEYEPFDGCETLYIYARLSFISRGNVPSGAKEFLYSEFNIRGNVLKYLVGKLLVFLATHAHGRGAARKLYITKGALGENAFISPQNRSIRIFDYDTMTVDCIIKAGFTAKYFNNQLGFRKKHSYAFVPPLLAFGDGWFRERIMRGNPLARVTDEAAYQAALEKAASYIHQLATDTAETVRATEYIPKLTTDIRRKLVRAKTEKHIDALEMLQMLVTRLEADAIALNGEIPLAISHGDLQSGNIWLESDGRVWIYDWETQGRRSVWYDEATLLLSTRRAGGLERLMNEKSTAGLWPDRSFDEIRQIQSVVLLEDMLFYLDDMLELPAEDGAEIFNEFAKRIIRLFERVD